MKKQTLPPGEYYIGDPCYVINGDDWVDFLDTVDYFSHADYFTYKGHPVFGSGTAYGDGSYLSSLGVRFAVDSGLLAALPVAVCDTKDLYETITQGLGMKISVDHPLECSEAGGLFTFGTLTIETGDEEEE